MPKTLTEIQKEIYVFINERNWNTEHPNELITSILIELGELAEHYQWKNEYEKYSEERKKEIGYEIVDVFVYLCRLANDTGIDITKMFEEKLPELAKKYPVGGDHKKAHDEYRKNGKNKLYD